MALDERMRELPLDAHDLAPIPLEVLGRSGVRLQTLALT
jgi:hypothetical protein